MKFLLQALDFTESANRNLIYLGDNISKSEFWFIHYLQKKTIGCIISNQIYLNFFKGEKKSTFYIVMVFKLVRLMTLMFKISLSPAYIYLSPIQGLSTKGYSTRI